MQEHDNASEADIAWAAGLFEGEGSWGISDRTSARAGLGMSDRDVVDRFERIVGSGTRSIVIRPSYKTLYYWRIQSASQVRSLVAMFLPYLGERRKARAMEILEATEVCRGPFEERTHCQNGHPYDVVNTYTQPGTS